MTLFNLRLSGVLNHNKDIRLYEIDEYGDRDGLFEFSISKFNLYTEKKRMTVTGGSRVRVSDLSFSGSHFPRDGFMKLFLYIEHISLYLLIYDSATSVNDLEKFRIRYSKISLMDRLKLARDIYGIKLKGTDLLELRNNLAHSIETEYIKYGKNYYWTDSESFKEKLLQDFNDIFSEIVPKFADQRGALASYKKELDDIDQKHISKTLEKINAQI